MRCLAASYGIRIPPNTIYRVLHVLYSPFPCCFRLQRNVHPFALAKQREAHHDHTHNLHALPLFYPKITPSPVNLSYLFLYPFPTTTLYVTSIPNFLFLYYGPDHAFPLGRINYIYLAHSSSHTSSIFNIQCQ